MAQRRARGLASFLAVVLTTALAFGLASAAAWASPSLLWRVSGTEGGELYILGSIHVGNPEMYPLDPAIYEAFGKAASLVVELQGDSLQNSPVMLNKVMAKGFYQNGETLLMHLDERQRELLEPFLDLLPMGGKTNMKPWLAAVTLDMIMLTKLGYSSKYGVDHYFQMLAKDKGLPVHSLETVEEQLGLFLGLSEEDSKLLLESSLIEFSEVENFMGEVMAAWKDGDEAEFADAFFEAYERWPKLVPLLDKIIYERNEVMYQRLLPYLEAKGTTFVVIGSGHVVTERGIPGLFKARGYQVEKF